MYLSKDLLLCEHRDTVWKVVAYDGLTLHSVYTQGVHRIQYKKPDVHAEGEHKPDEWTTGYLGTPVLAFSSKFLAECWQPQGVSTQLWQCEAEMIYHVDRLSAGQCLGYTAFWNSAAFWRGTVMTPPLGTVACNRIRLVKQLDGRRLADVLD